MKKEESNLWTRVKNHTAIHETVRLERVEALINPGMPDVHCLLHGRTSWIELKQVASIPEKKYGAVLAKAHQKLSQDQKNWHMDYRRCGGRVATLIGIGSYHYALVDGRFSDTINDMSWPLMSSIALASGDRYEFFPRILEWLDGRIN
ncbi:MAG TPA: hypothetical protein VF681_14680 [Abditibacteriaceae bacterium]|jgi:hypothetical protein